jgi:hypothetical protein
MESPEFYEETGIRIESPTYLGEYNKILLSLVKLSEQIMKYTETTKKETVTKNLSVQMKEIEVMTDDELNSELRRFIGGGKAKISNIIGRETKENIQ